MLLQRKFQTESTIPLYPYVILFLKYLLLWTYMFMYLSAFIFYLFLIGNNLCVVLYWNDVVRAISSLF